MLFVGFFNIVSNSVIFAILAIIFAVVILMLEVVLCRKCCPASDGLYSHTPL